MDDQSGGDRHDREAHLVRRMTPDSVNRRLDELTERRVREAAALPPEELDRRLRSLETAWTTERVLEANASALALLGVALAAAHDRRWLLLTGIVGGFLLQHSIQGWCPPLPVFRALGFRDRREIDEERSALKALRGDFDRGVLGGDPAVDPAAALEPIRR